ncbi:MAG: cation diffusion facilitator family transporter [Acidimicrobiia bacterium]
MNTEPRRTAQRRALWIALLANGGYLVVAIIGGFAFSSLALLADAAHMTTDVAALGIALGAQTLAARPASGRRTYGWGRAEILAAQANGVLLVAAAVWIVVEAMHRLETPEAVDGAGVILVAGIGLAVNVASAVLLGRVRGGNLNLRGAFLHMTLDALGSVGAIVAGVAVVAFEADRVDPAVSVIVAALVLWSAWGLLRDSANVLLEGVPAGLHAEKVEAALAGAPGVDAVHHLHLWELGSEVPALSAHVVFGGPLTLHDAQLRVDGLKEMLSTQFGIDHVTLELECHDCVDDHVNHS